MDRLHSNIEFIELRGSSRCLFVRGRAPLNGPDGSIEFLRQLAETSLSTPVRLGNRFAVFGAELCSGRSADTRTLGASVTHARPGPLHNKNSSPKTGSANSPVQTTADSSLVQAKPQSSTGNLISPEIVRAEEVRLENDVKMLTVGNAQGHYLLSCTKTLDSCVTPMPGKDYLLFSKATRWKFPGATGVVTLDFLQEYTVTYNNEENIALYPSEGDPGPAPDGTWHPAIGMYWLRSWSKTH